MKTAYTFEHYPKDEKYYLIFKGDFRAGSQFEIDRIKIESIAKKALESHVVVFNLTDVAFWDAETMTFIKSIVTTLNSSIPRAGIVGKKKEYIYNRLVEKFGEIKKPIIWEENEADLLAQLK